MPTSGAWMPHVFAPELARSASPQIAVIGAGVSGLACARALVSVGLDPHVIERSRECGGRCITRATEVGPFDAGAQDVSPVHRPLTEQMLYWLENEVAADWRVRVVRLAADGTTRAIPGPRYVGLPGAARLCEDLGRGIDIEIECQARRVLRDAKGFWHVQCVAEGRDVTRGPYAAVAIATAAAHAVPLLTEVPWIRAHAESVACLPVWTLLVAFAAPLDVPYDVALPDDPCIAWMARDSCKPGRPSGERWVVHASPDWSLAHVGKDAEEVRALMLAAFGRLTCTSAAPMFLAMHRWRYAVATGAIEAQCLWDDRSRLGACGDWMAREYAQADGTGNFESAYQSGSVLGERMAHALAELKTRES